MRSFIMRYSLVCTTSRQVERVSRMGFISFANMKLTLVLLILCVEYYWCDAARILLLGPVGTHSHKFVYMPILEGLAENGHHVTVVSPFAPQKETENIREIVIENVEVDDINFFQVRLFQGIIAVAPRFWVFGTYLFSIYDNLMSNQEFRQIQRDEQFDLILIDAIFNDFCLPLADLWQAPIITISASIGPPWILETMGVPHYLASHPSTWTSYGNQMSFNQRFFNTLETALTTAFRTLFVINPLNSKIRKDFPHARTIQEVERNISLCIVTSHPVLNWPRPLPPTVIEVNRLHIKEAKQLPLELQKYADESGENGFILFTLGSMIKSSTIPKATVQSFVRVFSQIPQRVIWKWESDDEPSNLPPNVLLVKWLPQSDLLAHQNARLFITHGGLLGIQEAIFFSVPLLGLPVINDQFINMVKLVKEGCGLSLEWTDINDHNLKTAITSLLQDPSYRDNMIRLNNIITDEPIPSKRKALYWIEYVLRHRGTKHMRMSSIDLPIYQHYLLDVIGVTILMVTIVTYITVFAVGWTCCRVTKTNSKKMK